MNHSFPTLIKMQSESAKGALERFKHEPTEGSLNVNYIASAKACRDIQQRKKTSWKNSQKSVKWNRIHKIKGKESSNTVHHLSVNDRDFNTEWGAD